MAFAFLFTQGKLRTTLKVDCTNQELAGNGYKCFAEVYSGSVGKSSA